MLATFREIGFALIENEIGVYWLARDMGDRQLPDEIGARTIASWERRRMWAPDIGV